MGMRYRKSVKMGPVRLNFSKSGMGYSIGSKGYRVTKKATGGYRKTISLPGTGLSYVKDYPTKKSGTSRSTTVSSTKRIYQEPVVKPSTGTKPERSSVAGGQKPYLEHIVQEQPAETVAKKTTVAAESVQKRDLPLPATEAKPINSGANQVPDFGEESIIGQDEIDVTAKSENQAAEPLVNQAKTVLPSQTNQDEGQMRKQATPSRTPPQVGPVVQSKAATSQPEKQARKPKEHRYPKSLRRQLKWGLWAIPIIFFASPLLPVFFAFLILALPVYFLYLLVAFLRYRHQHLVPANKKQTEEKSD